MGVIGSILNISIQFGRAKERYKKSGVLGRSMAFVGQLFGVALVVVGAWGMFASVPMIGTKGVILPIVLVIVCALTTLISALWVVLWVIAFVPVLTAELREHKRRRAAGEAGETVETATDDGTAPKMSKAADIVFIVLNFLTLPLAIGVGLYVGVVFGDMFVK